MPEGPQPPDDPRALDPAVSILPAGTALFRVHPERFPANAFNPGHGSGARFHFIEDGAGQKIPSLYAAESVAATLAETVFHDVPVRPHGDRRIGLRKLQGRHLSTLRTRRDLALVQLHHPGIGRLGLRPRNLTDTDPSAYPRTRAWAQRLHDHGDHAGLVWMSRLHNEHRAYTFFGDRVRNRDFQVTDGPLPLWREPGIELVYEQAEAAGITVVHP